MRVEALHAWDFYDNNSWMNWKIFKKFDLNALKMK
jgi:hypothetical protein